LATQAKQALAQLGFKKPDAARYVNEALAMATGLPTLEDMIRAALQRSRKADA
jgi:Holliday junction resolvasome RuvABC DNA-binding subunit